MGFCRADHAFYFPLLLVAGAVGLALGGALGFGLLGMIGVVVGAVLGSVCAILGMVVIEGRLTGKHALSLILFAFVPIFIANGLLASSAVRTFPGLEVKNSYIASQSFDARRAAQTSLGWQVRADAQDGAVRLSITDAEGAPVEVASLEAVLGRATHVQDDMTPDFRFDGAAYVAPVDLADGNWNIRMKATARDGTVFEQRVVLHVIR